MPKMQAIFNQVWCPWTWKCGKFSYWYEGRRRIDWMFRPSGGLLHPLKVLQMLQLLQWPQNQVIVDRNMHLLPRHRRMSHEEILNAYVSRENRSFEDPESSYSDHSESIQSDYTSRTKIRTSFSENWWSWIKRIAPTDPDSRNGGYYGAIETCNGPWNISDWTTDYLSGRRYIRRLPIETKLPDIQKPFEPWMISCNSLQIVDMTIFGE